MTLREQLTDPARKVDYPFDPFVLDWLAGKEKAVVVASYGGGLNSTAFVVLLHWLRIRPDAALFADTGGEKPETYENVERVSAWCESVGLPRIVTVRRKVDHARQKSEQKYNTLEEECLAKKTLPSIAFYGRSCSEKWKHQPQEKWANDWEPAKAAWRAGKKVVKVIGYDADERRRAKIFADDKYVYYYPLLQWDWGRDECKRAVREAGLPVPPKSSCFFCLGGETEVVTRNGIKPIRELAGSRPELLVPGNTDLTGAGAFRECEVKSFGEQPLYRVTLTRAGVDKDVYATAEHRWFVRGRRATPVRETTTVGLKAGDRLMGAKAPVAGKTVLVPFAVAQGFVYGDGTVGQGERPASLRVYTGTKADALLPYFATHKVTASYDASRFVYGLPRTWKELSTIRESRSFLLSWLAGYFAADGDVTEGGYATFSSADADALRFVREAAAVCGVRYGTVVRTMRTGFGAEPTPLYRLGIDARDAPPWFFLLEHHAERVRERAAKFADAGKKPKNVLWAVKDVQPTARVEEVYCAVVPGPQAFVLADGILTGNCPEMKPWEILQLKEKNPDLLERALAIESNAVLTKIKGLGKHKYSWRDFIDGKIELKVVKQAEEEETLPCNCYDGGSGEEADPCHVVDAKPEENP